MLQKVIRYQQYRYITPTYRFAPKMTRITEYYLPDEKLLLYTDGNRILDTEPCDGPRLSVPNHDRSDGSTCQAEEVEEVTMETATYDRIVKWHEAKAQAREIRAQLEDVFFNEPDDL